MQTESLLQRNVVVLPVGDTSREAQRLSQELERFDTEFTLGAGCFDHLSIYQAAYPAQNEEKLFEVVERIAAETSPFEITLQGFSVFWETFLFWDVVKTAELTSLHLRLLSELNPLREGVRLPIHEQILADERVPLEFRESIRRYGNPLCGRQERPHVTLTRLKEVSVAEDALAILTSIAPEPRIFTPLALFVTEVGPHGTCPRAITAFPLRG